MFKTSLLLAFLTLTSCLPQNKDLVEITVGPIQMMVELAETPEKRKQGLMHREVLAENQGMLFIFEKEQKMSFWMKNTSIPLSIAYISKSGHIREIHDMTPFSEAPVQSSYSVIYALEVNQGYFEAQGIKIGDRVSIPDRP